MKLDGRNISVCSSNEASICMSIILLAFLSVCVATQRTAVAQQQTVISAESSPLTTVRVVEKLVGMNLLRAQALHSYHGTRTYRAEYRGLFSTTSAEMVVDVTYRAPGTKEFAVRSSTGSKLIIDKVFKKLLQAEEEALSADAQRRTALSGENYEFTMIRYETTGLRPTYVLAVEPKNKSKFLFRGRVWVDAGDFAVVRVEAEPARSPSFWTKSSQIEQLYQKLGDFWLPQRNHSISSIRIGGRAELTIVYQDYEITASDPIGRVPGEQIARSPDKTLSQSPCGH
jgi:hypothetical protein